MAKTESIPFLTPWFTARYPKISKADTKGQYADGKFKTDGVFLDAEGLATTEKALKEATAKFWPSVPVNEVSLPVKNFYASKEDKEKKKVEARGITLKSKYRPAAFDAKKVSVPLDNVTIGGGSVIRVASAIFPWSKTTKFKGQDVTEYGVSMRLGDIQIRKLCEAQSQVDGSAFDEDDEGFTYEGAAGAEQFGDATDL